MLCPFCQTPVDRFLPPEDGSAGLRCPHCRDDGVPLLYPKDYARHPAVPVSICGPTGHGKTVFIDALLTHLERRVRWPNFSTQWMDPAGMRAGRERLRVLREHGQLPDATPSVFPRPQVVRLRGVPRVGGCQLLFYDTSGETFRDAEQVRDQGRFVRNSAAVLWLVSLTELEYPEQLPDLMTVYAQAMAEMGADPKRQAVVVGLTKGDLLVDRPDLPAAARDFLRDDDLDPAGDAWDRLDRLSDALKGWLRGTDHRLLVNLLDEQFRAARYCVLSAQGAAARDQVLQAELTPRGVLAPLLWLWRESLPVAWAEPADGPPAPYFSLAEAVEAVPPGGRVRLDAGEYVLPDRLEVRRPVRVVGPGAGACAVRSAAGGAVLAVAPAAGEVALSGVTVEHTGTAPADVVQVARGAAVLTDCVIAGAAGGDGVRASASAAVRLAGCVVERNAGNGVSSRDAAAVRLTGCTVRDNGLAGVAAAGAVAEVWSSRVTGNRQSGVYLTGTVRGAVHQSACRGNRGNGVLAAADASAELHGNTCSGNGGHGIAAKDRAAVALRDNACDKNAAAGVAVVDAVTGEVAGTACTGNALAGIAVEGAAAPAVTGNQCSKNGRAGIGYTGTAGGACTGNTCTKNAGDGVRVGGSASPTVDGNVSRRNGGYGFLVAEGAGPSFGRANAADNNTAGDFYPERLGSRWRLR